MEIKTSDKKNLTVNILLIILCLGFYVFFYILDGAVICADSHSYIYMSVSRERFYPVLIAIFRGIFGGIDLPGHIGYINADVLEGSLFYLEMAALFQSLLAAVCTLSLVFYVRRATKAKYAESFLLLSFCLGVSLLCRVAAKRSSMYSNCILTEGIACSLFLLFIRFLYQYMLEKKQLALVISAILSFILITTRKQMYITLAMVVLAIIFTQIRAGTGKKGNTLIRIIILSALYTTLIIGANRGFEAVYSHFMYGEQFTHTQDNRFVTTMVFYTAERSDADRIEDKELRELFLSIYDACDAEGDLMDSAPEGIYASVSHFGDHYDMIQLDHMQSSIEEYAAAECGDSILEKEEMIDMINSVYIKTLLPATWTKILYVFALNGVEGMTNTVAKFAPKFIIYAAVVWIIYIALWITGVRRRGLDEVNVFALLTFVSCFLNIALVAMVIFCQTRYMIYNMPLFYISMWLMIRELWKNKRVQAVTAEVN